MEKSSSFYMVSETNATTWHTESTENMRKSAASFMELTSEDVSSSSIVVREFIMNSSSAHDMAKSAPATEEAVLKALPLIHTFKSSRARRV